MLESRHRRFDGKDFVLHGIFDTKKEAKAAASNLKRRGYYYRTKPTSKGIEVWVSKYPQFYYM